MIEEKFDTTGVKHGTLTDFVVYPNPTSGYLKIQGQEMMQITSYNVSDVSGKSVLSGELTANQIKQSRIDMTSLKRGLYLVKLSGERINRVVKVVKE